MAIWYNIGTASVRTGSDIVDGAGCAFVANVNPSDAFKGRGYASIEIAEIISATRLRLAEPWTGPSLDGLLYSVHPTTAVGVALARDAFERLAAYREMSEGYGRGLLPDGSTALPSMRFASDQDTGIFRPGENNLSLVAGGVQRITANNNGADVRGSVNASSPEFPQFITTRDGIGSWLMGGSGAGSNNWSLKLNAATYLSVDTAGQFGINTAAPASALDVNGLVFALGPKIAAPASGGSIRLRDDSATLRWLIGHLGTAGNQALSFYNLVTGSEAMRFDNAGNMLVGFANANQHVIARAGNQGAGILSIYSPTSATVSAFFFAASGANFSGAACAMQVGRNTDTGRSINAGGTINANGADLAEYWFKAPYCGTILKGQVCGVDVRGDLTDRWSEAKSFGAKATLPGLVMGDSYAKDLGERPTEPKEGANVDAVAAWKAADAAWVDAEAIARAKVDRIAFAGRIPIDIQVTAAQAGDYIIAGEGEGGTIVPRIVAEADMTLPLYMRRIGRILCPMAGNLAAEIEAVWQRPANGRAWVDVQRS